MNLKLVAVFVLSCAAVLVSGCVSTVDGQMRAGLPFVKDSLVSRYERPPAQIVSAARIVINRNGQLTGDNIVNNTLVGRIDTRTVWVQVTPLDERVTQVVTQVRTKGGRSDLDLASEIDKQIAVQLAAGN
jgi:hypothetical protein